jgi:hypothetical protein
MTIKTHQIENTAIAEVTSTEMVIASAQDGLDLLGNLYYQDVDKIIIHERSLTPDFFDLKTGIAGELLQKFSNYRVRLAIVGDFAKYTGKSINDFIYESNKGGHINFVASQSEAIEVLLKK